MSYENERWMRQTLQVRWQLKNHVTIPIPLPEQPMRKQPVHPVVREQPIREQPIRELRLLKLPLPELNDGSPLHEQWLNVQGPGIGDEEREAVRRRAFGHARQIN